MRRTVLGIGSVGSLLLAAAPAFASLGLEEPPDHAPLESVIGDIVEGSSPAELTFPDGSGGPIVDRFQFVVNLATDWTFIDNELGVEPYGTTGGPGELTWLIEQMGPGFANIFSIPPLAPELAELAEGTTSLDSSDVSAVFSGWEAFDAGGPVEGPIVAVEAPTVVWGVRLAQPFDTSCASPQFVGRAWPSMSVTSDNDPFTVEALGQSYPGTHAAIAERTGRLIQLSCLIGGDPWVTSNRMNNGRVRPWGPLGTVALVRDDLVLFLSALRNVDDSLTEPLFYASGSDGAVVPSEFTPIETVGLVPNPYDGLPDRIDFLADQDSIQIIPAASAVDDGEGQQRDLLYRGEGYFRPAGVHCDVGVTVAYAALTASGGSMFDVRSSRWRSVTRDGDTVVTEQSYPDGSRDVITLDMADGTYRAELRQADGSDDPDCIIEGTFLINLEGSSPSSSAGEESSGESGSTAGTAGDDSSSVDTTPASDGGDGSSPVLWVVIGGVAVAVTVAVARGRRETEDTTDSTVISSAEPDPPTWQEDAGNAFLDAFAALGSPTVSGGTSTAEAADSAWSQLEQSEQRVQDKIAEAVDSALGPATKAFGDYERATERFREAFHKMVSGSTELQGMLREWAEVQDIAYKQDIAFAIASIAFGGVGLAYQGSKAVNTAKYVPWHRWSATGRMAASSGRKARSWGGTVVGARGAAKAGDELADELIDAFAVGDNVLMDLHWATAGTAAARVNRANRQKFFLQYVYKPHVKGAYVAAIHGSRARLGGGFGMIRNADGAWIPMDVATYAQHVRRGGWREGQVVQLVSCNSAVNGSAGKLAKELRTWVVAPTKELQVHWGRGGAPPRLLHEADGYFMAFDPAGTLRYVSKDYGKSWQKWEDVMRP